MYASIVLLIFQSYKDYLREIARGGAPMPSSGYHPMVSRYLVRLIKNIIIPREAKGYSFGLVGLSVRPSRSFFDFVRL